MNNREKVDKYFINWEKFNEESVVWFEEIISLAD